MWFENDEHIRPDANIESMTKLNTIFKKDGVRFETVIKEVSPLGRLITVDAIEREFVFGDVEWVL